MSEIDPDQLFVPRHAIRSQTEFFAGRRDFLLNLLDELGTPGTSVVLCGDRGIGKTSLAWQAFEVLAGSRKLPRRWGEPKLQLKRDFRPYWLQCDESMVSIEGALLRMLMPSDLTRTLGDRHSKLLQDAKRVESFRRKYKIDFGIVGGEFEFLGKSGEVSERNAERLLEKRAAIRAMFMDVLNQVHRQRPDHDIVLFLDEIDVLKDKDRIGSLIKDTNNASFVIIGILDGPGDVVGDHPSAKRKLAKIPRVPGLNRDELDWFLARGEALYRGRLFFTSGFREAILEKSQGFPFLIQALGHAAVKAAIREQADPSLPLRVGRTHLRTSVSKLIDPERHDPLYANLRHIMLSDQVPKHEILSALARFEGPWIPIEDLVPFIPRRQIRFLQSNIEALTEAGILDTAEERVRFRDPIGRLLVQLDEAA